MSAEPIARVIDDLKSRRVFNALRNDPELFDRALSAIQDPTVVDATEIYRSLVAKDEPVAIYEDHPCIAPPWNESAVCYLNEHSNVVVMHMRPVDNPDRVHWDFADPTESWDNVHWLLETFIWCGGRSDRASTPVPTAGPFFGWLFAIAADGRPIDLRWVHLDIRLERTTWDMAQLVHLGTLNFMNCRNIELVEPVRPRAQRRRLARIGVTVNTIQVRPTGRATRGAPRGDGLVPLTSVRGHFAHYGDCCPMRHPPHGKLFGRLTGRFWVPQFARGSAEAGESQHDYRIRVEP